MGKYKRPAKRRAEAARRAEQAGFQRFAPIVRAKVGAITFVGIVNGDAFEYVTSKGDQRTARKFTLV